MDKEIAEIRKKAKVVAEVTGRSVDAVIDDLMDDGIVNLSNEENKEKNLVEQLKEAAELITTVQSISQEVSENTVLNGGENSTEVKVETTLEGDIVDRAIESLQKKADNIKKLGLTLVPIFLLITGGSMEAIGLIDLMPTEVNGGDDGCDPMWGYDEYGYLDDNNLEVRFTFQDYMNCGIEHFGGHFIITLFESGDETEQVFINNIDFIDYISIEHTFMGLEGGDYHYRVEFHVVECEDGSCEHGDEYYLPTSNDYYIEVVEVIGCDAYLINEQAYLLESDPEKVQISADVALVEEENNCDSEQFEITWRLYQGDVVKYEHKTYENGIVTDPDGADYTNHIWDFVDEGTYTPKVILKLNGEILDEKWISHSINREAEPIYGCTDDSATNYDSLADNDDGSCEYPPEEPCEINLFGITLLTNNTTATVAFDLDCGYEENDLEGYNVSVQFLVYEIGSSNNTAQPIIWETTLCYIEGYADDIRTLLLDNFTSNNTTHYDFYWYATWTNADGDIQFIERKWLNRELSP